MSTYSVYNIKIDNQLSFSPGKTQGSYVALNSDGTTYFAVGAVGSSGTSGVSGSSGTSGVSGSSGTSGVSGSSGTSGVAGLNGSSGTSGINGSSGTSGIDGSSGSSGTSGSGGSNPIAATSSNQTLTGNATSAVAGLTFSVNVGTYTFEMNLQYNTNSDIVYGLTWSGSVNTTDSFFYIIGQGTPSSSQLYNLTTFIGAGATSSFTVATGGSIKTVKGYIIITGTGSFGLTLRPPANLDISKTYGIMWPK